MNHSVIKETIASLIGQAGFSADGLAVTFDEKANTIWFSLPGSDARVLLSRDAEVLNALNHLGTKMVEKMAGEGEKPPRIVIDANDFEKKKIDNLKTIAHMMAERARYFKSSIDIDPMPAHERRVVHEFLSEMPDIQTESTGEGRSRHIVIKYVEPGI
jgi:spoIIIJ-associated protein